MAVTRTARLGLVLWSSDEDTTGSFREELVETFTRLEERAALRTEVTAETTARTAAINAEATARAAADTAEATARAAADTSIRTDFAAADTAERDARIAADALLMPLAGGTFTGAVTGTDLTLSGALSVAGTISAPDGTVNVTGDLDVATAAYEAGSRLATRSYVDTAVGNSSTTTSGNLNDHKNDTTDSHHASSITFQPVTGIAATTVQAAIAEVVAEFARLDGATFTGNVSLTGTATLAVAGLLTATGGLALPAGADVTIAATTGSRIGQAGSRIAFYGATPVLRPGTYSVDASTVTSRSLAAYTPDNEGTIYTGVATTLADAATRAELNALRAAYENLRAYVEDLGGLTAANTRDLITLGLFG